jgi:hypothetical protein
LAWSTGGGDIEKHPARKMAVLAATAENVASHLKYPILAAFREAYCKLTLRWRT